MAVAAAVACVVVACVYNCVCYCCPSLLDRARVATRDGATHSNECARSTAGRVAAVAVVAIAVVCVAVARVCVCVCVCVLGILPRSSPRSNARSRDA